MPQGLPPAVRALRGLDSAGRLWKRPTLGWYLTSPRRRTELRICGRLRFGWEVPALVI